MKDLLIRLGDALRLSPVDFDFFTLATCCNLADRVSRFFPRSFELTDHCSNDPMTRLFGMLSTEGPSVNGTTHPSSGPSPLPPAEESADEETSPRWILGPVRDRLRFLEEDDGAMMLDSGIAGGRPTAKEGEEGCRDSVRYFVGDSDIKKITERYLSLSSIDDGVRVAVLHCAYRVERRRRSSRFYVDRTVGKAATCRGFAR